MPCRVLYLARRFPTRYQRVSFFVLFLSHSVSARRHIALCLAASPPHLRLCHPCLSASLFPAVSIGTLSHVTCSVVQALRPLLATTSRFVSAFTLLPYIPLQPAFLSFLLLFLFFPQQQYTSLSFFSFFSLLRLLPPLSRLCSPLQPSCAGFGCLRGLRRVTRRWASEAKALPRVGHGRCHAQQSQVRGAAN